MHEKDIEEIFRQGTKIWNKFKADYLGGESDRSGQKQRAEEPEKETHTLEKDVEEFFRQGIEFWSKSCFKIDRSQQREEDGKATIRRTGKLKKF